MPKHEAHGGAEMEGPPPQLEEGNLYQTQREKHTLRRIRGAKDEPPVGKRAAEREITDIATRSKGLIGRLGGLSPAMERYRQDKERAEQEILEERTGIDEEGILDDLGERAEPYRMIRDLTHTLDELNEFEMRRMLDIRTDDPHARRAHERLLATIRAERAEVAPQLETLATEHPIEARAHELIRDKEGLFAEGHIAPTESVREDLQTIGRKMLAGKPMLLHGPTGTGKTSLARYAARHFTGKPAEMVYCSPQTRESSVWGKQGIALKEGQPVTVDIYGPLAKAMQEGRVVIFDEFSALPKEQMVFIKGIFNAKVGDEVNVVGNGRVRIAPGFQMLFTANLKSEKNKERSDMPPEIAREFEQNNIEIGYHPAHEAYDIMLARLMEPDGSVTLSWHDLRETLPKLVEAMTEIQGAYTGALSERSATLTGTLDASGRRPSLEKLVMTQGTIEAILADFAIARATGASDLSFVEHIDRSLKTGLTFKEYSDKDRVLAAKILASKGLLRTLAPADLGLPVDIFNFEAARSLRGDPASIEALIARSRDEIRHPLAEIADLDPFLVRGRAVQGDINDLVGTPEGTPGGAEATPLDDAVIEQLKLQLNAFIRDTYTGKWGLQASQLPAAGFSPTIATTADYQRVLAQTAAEIAAGTSVGDTTFIRAKEEKFGEYTLHQEALGVDFETARVFTPDLSAFNGRPRFEVMKHLFDTYGQTHYIPGMEYWKWVIENPTKSHVKLPDDTKWYYFFGSTFRSRGGSVSVPCVGWNGTEWRRHGSWLEDDWDSSERVVLLER